MLEPFPDLDVPEAPPSFNELALMQFVVESKDVIRRNRISNRDAIDAFTRQLFCFLATQHRAGICFSRDAGCCMRPEFLLPSGSLTDVYFMARPEDKATFLKARETDLWNALLVACDAANTNISGLIAILTSAITHYVPKTWSENVDYLVRERS